MKFTHDLTYDASPEQVHAMLSDPGFRERVCQAVHAVRHDVSLAADGDTMRVTVDQTQPARGIPSFAKKFVGDEIRIVQHEAWSGPNAAGLDLEIPGKPARMKGGIVLRGDATSTTETVDGDIKVSVPLVGGRLEAMIADLLRSALRAEHKVGRKYLAG